MTLDVRPLGSQGLKVSAQGLGCMSLTKGFYATEATAPRPEDATAVIYRALELGVTFINTANLYGPFVNEELIGAAFKERPMPTIMSKWGPLITETGWVHRSDREWARWSIEGQLQRLGVKTLDLWVLRGFTEPKTSVEETMAAVKEIVAEGKVKYVGLSECTADQIRRAHAIFPITALEIEWSLWSRENEVDVIPLARELGIGLVPWAPLGSGMLTAAWKTRDEMPDDVRKTMAAKFSAENFDENMKLVENVKVLADKKGCTPGQLALAWVHAQGEDVFPIPGTKRIKYLEENIAAYEISKTLTKQELADLEAAVPADQVHGVPISDVRKPMVLH